MWRLGAALLCYYLLVLGGHHYSIDGIVMFQSAKQLFFRHTLILDPPVVWGGTPIRVSQFSIGLTLAYLPVLLFWSPLFYAVPALQQVPFDPSTAYNRALYSNLPYLLCSVLNPLISAATGCLVFQLARRLGLTRGWAVATTLAYGLASPAVAYARYDFAQPLAALALTAAVWALLGADDSHGGRRLSAGGAALGCAFLTRPEFALLALWVLGWLGVHSRRRGLRAAVARMTAVAAPVGLAVALYLGMNWLRFGSIARTGYRSLSEMFNLSPSGTLEGLVGLLASPGRGLLLFFPLSWLALPGLLRLIKTRNPAGTLFTGLIAVALVMYGSFYVWWAGWSWGPRFLVPLLPLMALAAGFWAAASPSGAARPTRRIVFTVLALVGALVSSNAILFDFVTYYGWVHRSMQWPDTGSIHFSLSASPLISGWSLIETTPVDLALVKLWRSGRVVASLAAATIALGLLGGLAWLGCGIHARLRRHRGD